MAINTRERRMSTMHHALPLYGSVNADGTIDSPGRIASGHVYNGITLTAISGFAAGAGAPDAIGRALWQRPAIWLLLAVLIGW